MGKGGCRIDIESLPPKLRIQAYEQLANNSPSNPPSNMEQAPRRKQVEKKEDSGYDSPCSIVIRSVRKKLADPDGISGKAAIDGLVHCGVLRGDTVNEIQSVSFEQEKGKEEYTEIIITPCPSKHSS